MKIKISEISILFQAHKIKNTKFIIMSELNVN